MKKTVIFLGLLLTAFTGNAQQATYLIAPNKEFSSVSSFSEGLARVQFWSSRRVTFIDTAGKVKHYTENYRDAGNFHNGLAWVAKEIKDKTLYGFINTAGKLVIPYQFDAVEDFLDNRAVVLRGNVWQYINRQGKVIPAVKKYTKEKPHAFACGRAPYQDDKGRYGYIDTNGHVVIPAQFYEAFDFADGVAVVAADTVAATDMKGDDELSRLYNSLPNGPTQYRYRVIDTAGNTRFAVSSNQTLDLNRNFSNGLRAFMENDGWGVINTQGQVVIPPKLRNEPLSFHGGVGFVQVDGNESTGNKDGYLLTLDTRGNTIAKVPFVTSYGNMYDSNLAFHEGLMAVKIGDLWGYIDKTGKMVIAPQFDSALDFREGFAVVTMPDGPVAVIKHPGI